jgi:hypothetical protein
VRACVRVCMHLCTSNGSTHVDTPAVSFTVRPPLPPSPRAHAQLDLPGPAVLQTKYVSFIIATAIIWTLVCVSLSVGARFKVGVRAGRE